VDMGHETRPGLLKGPHRMEQDFERAHPQDAGVVQRVLFSVERSDKGRSVRGERGGSASIHGSARKLQDMGNSNRFDRKSA